MFSWFKKNSKSDKKIKISVEGVNPQTNNEFLFYDFVQFKPKFLLKEWYLKAKSLGLVFKPEYENAILLKIKTGEFQNPYSFPEYFNNKFEFIAIDFETANQNRVSACAIGLVFVKNDIVVYKTFHHINPPENEYFSNKNIQIHGITKEDVDYAFTFDTLWEIELSKYFNDNLIIFHNASMDLSVLKNLFNYYKITNYEINYLDTMQLASKAGYPKKITELAEEFDVDYIDKHNPEEDARVCALVFGELIELYPQYENLIKTLSYKEVKKEKIIEKESIELKNQNLEFIQAYSLKNEELESLSVEGKAFLFTGDIMTERNKAKDFIEQNGGFVKSGVSSKVDYVVIGVNYGWSKIQKIHDLNKNKSCNIKILTNSHFDYLKSKYS